MTTVETVLGGIVVSVLSVGATKIFNGKGKMTENHCTERQAGCRNLIIEKIDNLSKKVDHLCESVKGKDN